jgi:hypothetical protein
MQEAEAVFQKIEESFEALRRAVESRHYEIFESLLQLQRGLLRSVSPSDPRAPELALRGRELVYWATTMVKIQRSGHARSLAAILSSKHLKSMYAGIAPRCADSISLEA